MLNFTAKHPFLSVYFILTNILFFFKKKMIINKKMKLITS